MIMKILHIYGDDDYHFLAYEQCELSQEEVIEKYESSPDKKCYFEFGEYESFYAQILEFKEVDPKFVEFVKRMQDYDDTKHENFIVIKP